MDAKESLSSRPLNGARNTHERGGVIEADDVARELNGAPAPVFNSYSLIKRSLDILLSGVCLLLLAPLMVLIAAAVRLTSEGPATFDSTRLGYRARPFRLRKFRTMRIHIDPERNKEFVGGLISGKYGSVGDSATFKLKHDPRVTPVGRFLRRTSLDELPQLWNVFLGDMSLVGPRPVVPYELIAHPSTTEQRLSVTPGITGLWQITGRLSTSLDDMTRLDLVYIRQRSIKLDLMILIRTVNAVLRTDKAY